MNRLVAALLISLGVIGEIGAQNRTHKRIQTDKRLPPAVISIDLQLSPVVPFDLPDQPVIPEVIESGISSCSGVPSVRPFERIHSRSREEVVQDVMQAQAVVLPVENGDDPPLHIFDVILRAVNPYHSEPSEPPESSRRRQFYVFSLQATLTNNTEREILGFGLSFADKEGYPASYFYPVKTAVEPYSFLTFGEDQFYETYFSSPLDELMLKVTGVVFEDGSEWVAKGSYVSPYDFVDSRPRLLNSAKPHYTNEAVENNVTGIVALRILVDADGTVKQAKLLSGLPDGLNEKAIEAAFKMRFEPAKRGGHPVPFWVKVEIEFRR